MSLLNYFYPERFTRLSYQVFLMGITILSTTYIVYKTLNRFIATDPAPLIKPLTPETAKIVGITTKSITVETGLYIENFSEFDLVNNNFILSGLVWFKFDPSVTSLDTIGQFSFEKGDILSVSKPETKLIDKLLFAQYRIKLKFSTNLDHRLFPVEDHRIFVIMTNKFVSPKEIIFESVEADFTLSPNIQISGWKRSKTSVSTGFSMAVLDRHNEQTTVFNPAVVYEMNFSNAGFRKLFIIILPLFFVLFVALLSITLNPELFLKERITLTIANITAIIGYRFVIESISPKVGYLMLSDHIFNLFLAIVFLIFFFNMATLKEASERLRGSMLIVLHTIFITLWYYLFIFWIG